MKLNLSKKTENKLPPVQVTKPAKRAFDPLPEGIYTVEIIKWESKQTKAGDGSFANIQFLIVEGAYKNRRVFHTILTEHPSAKALAFNSRKAGEMLRAFKIETEDLEDGLSEIRDKKLRADVRVIIEENLSGRRDNKVAAFTV